MTSPSARTTYARLLIEPFERGFGTTVGNSLRRILLSSLEGAAVTKVRIAGASHEFMSLPGVMEDVTDIILNIKNLVLRMEGEGEKTMKLVRKGPGEVFARDIEPDASIQIINQGQLIATLTEPVELSIEFWVSPGRGYRTSEENQVGNDELGVIAVDSVFSPVTRVRYKTEETRVGQRTNYDRLIMEIWTKGTIRPEDAMVEAAKILRKHLNPFVGYQELGEETAAAEAPAMESTAATAVDRDLQDRLSMPIAQLDLSGAGGQLPAVREGQHGGRTRPHDRNRSFEGEELRPDVASRSQAQAGGPRPEPGNDFWSCRRNDRARCGARG